MKIKSILSKAIAFSAVIFINNAVSAQTLDASKDPQIESNTRGWERVNRWSKWHRKMQEQYWLELNHP